MSANDTAVKERSYRLPKTVVPSFYDIHITPDMKAFTFTGKQKVLLEVKEPVTEIILNSAEINIGEAVLTDDSGTRMIGHVRHDETNEQAVITFDGTVGDGHWELDLVYTGIINNKLRGFYRSTYKTADGKEAVIATTKFEPCDARRAFPCWDEPGFKARFKIALTIPEEYNAISNAALMKTSDVGGGKKKLEFAPSIVMSTYLVAYVIGNLEASKPVQANMGDAGSVDIRVWAIPGKCHLAGFALDAARFSLEYFARYFQEPYPSNKLDLVAIPDFASGAMENFGCITFRETALLVDMNTASHAELERVAEVVMHENAHMWFGDYTTMSWWNGLWLNEAFATFMAAKAVDAWKPEWRFWEGFNVQRAIAMRVDGLRETRSIEFHVNNPEEARGMFDVLTYEKGCAVLRMLELLLGEEKFRAGIVNYVHKHAFANADTPDLWAAIEQMVNNVSETVTVTDLMNSWVFQPGYPLITVEQSPVAGSVTFKQSIFRYLDDGKKPATLWHVPVHIRAVVDDEHGKQHTIERVLLLSKAAETFYIGENLSSIVVNAGGHGFYRVRYSDALQQKLMDNLSILTASERFNLVNDMWAAVQSGQMHVKDYLAQVGTLTCTFGETDVNVFNIVLGSLTALRRILCQDEEAVAIGLLNLACSFLVPALNRIGWWDQIKADESPQQAQLRGSIVSMLGVLGDDSARRWAQTAFKKYQTDKSTVDTNLVGAMIDTLAANGDQGWYETFLSMKETAATPQEEQRYLFALAQFADKDLQTRTLESCINGKVRTQDAPFLLRSVLMNPRTRTDGGKKSPAWDFVKAHWDTMSASYPMSGMSRMCEGVTALVSPELQLDVQEFLSTHPVKGGEKAIKQYLEQLQIAVEMSKRERGLLQDLLLSAYQAKLNF